MEDRRAVLLGILFTAIQERLAKQISSEVGSRFPWSPPEERGA